MQLKWRIFLASLALIMLAVSGIAMTILHIDLSDKIEILINTAVQGHGRLAQTLQNRVAYEKLDSSMPLLTDNKLSLAASLAASSGMSQRENTSLCGASITADGNIFAQFGDEAAYEKLPKNKEFEYGKCYSCIYNTDDGYRLASSSVMSIEERQLFLYTVYDIDSTFASYNSNLIAVWLVSIGFSLVISLILFAVISYMLRPLSGINTTLTKIAGGSYGERVAARGKTMEIAQITESINTMAEAVENNVEKLESIANGRKRYINSLAHEMKTPLTSILCFGDLLRIKRSVSDRERLEYAGVIVDEANRMKNMSSKLLELACADNAELDMEKTSVSELLREVVSAMGPALESRGISLSYSGDDGYILCDRELFKSLIYNLCDNAAKASDEGSKVQLRSSAAPNGMVISVRDYGVGMTKDVLKKVTEPFYMADKSRSRKAGGAGLGLSLCVEIAKRHSARISAKSKPGVGTSIFVTVPYYTEDAEKGGKSNESI